MNTKNGKIKIDDTDAYYVSFGEGSKNLIIVLGVGDGFKTVEGLATQFLATYKEFTKDYKVYIFSRRNKIPNDFTTEDMANDIIEHMNKLNISKADIIGISQGGMIAEYIAINAPKKVNKLVLVVTVARPNKLLVASSYRWIELAKNNDYKGIMIDTAEKLYTGSYLEENRKLYRFLGLFADEPTYERFIKECQSCLNHNAYSKLDQIKCPTLIIGARKDKSLGYEGSVELHEKIKDSELYIYEEYSHGVYEQAPDFNERVLKFLKK